ncbi:hypothetical protein NDA12_002331 [Ustilago hordei]|nr:hypothetical protein NDA15_006806 [Ustilago hordei]KAJ1577204.1 hypothetical protein NDA12_002331 [Ustilago hordei]
MATSLQNHPYKLPTHSSSLQADTSTGRYHPQSNTAAYDTSNTHASPSSAVHAGTSAVTIHALRNNRSSARLQPPIDTPSSTASSSTASSSNMTFPLAGPSPLQPQPKPSHLGSELFDAIVQAADPRHPDHAAWQERYGSLSTQSSRASFSSASKRDKLASPRVGTPSSRKSLDHSDLPTRRKQTSRRAGTWHLPKPQSQQAGASDADDPLAPAFHSGDDRSTPVRASFEGSVRSYRSSSVTSSSHRRRNRRLRDANRPKPLLPPIPPPRVTSSTNWQSTFGSPSLPELANSTPRTANQPSSSSTTSDNHDHDLHPVQPQPLLPSPSAPASLRIAHPYASAISFDKVHQSPQLSSMPSILQPSIQLCQPGPRLDRSHARQQSSTCTSAHPSHVASLAQASITTLPGDTILDDKSFLHLPRRPLLAGTKLASPPSQPSTPSRPTQIAKAAHQIAPSRRSLSKIHHLLGPEMPTLGGPLFPEKPGASIQQATDPMPRSPTGPPPAVPPKHSALPVHQKTGSVPRLPVPALTSEEAQEICQSLDVSQKVDLNIFPLRHDDQFRANDNEFENSDDQEPEDNNAEGSGALPHLSTSAFHYTQQPSAYKPSRGPGVVRRSLDSIISPFRAGLLNGPATTARPAATGNRVKSILAVPQVEPILRGRRSFSDSRFVRPFLPRPRNATLARHTRPLSKVLDRPENEIVDALRCSDIQQRVTVPSTRGNKVSNPAAQAPQDRNEASTLNAGAANAAESPSSRKSRSVGLRRKALPQAGTEFSGIGCEASYDNVGGQDASLPTMSSSRSIASTFSRSTSNLHESVDSPYDTFARNASLTISQQQPRRGKIGGFFSKVKSSMTPKATQSTPARQFPTKFSSSAASSPYQASFGSPAGGPPGYSPANANKADRPFRNRVKSLTSPRRLSSSRSNNDMAAVPAVPAIPQHLAGLQKDNIGNQEHMQSYSRPSNRILASMSASFASPEQELTRSVWEESPMMPTSSSFASAEKASRSLGRLLRRMKTQEDFAALTDSFVPLPPKISHPDLAEQTAPRSSMSSTRGFDVVEPVDPSVPVGQTRTTIRKTLSPALLSETPQPGLEATLDDADLSTLGFGDNGRSRARARARTDFEADNQPTGEDAAEELGETFGNEQRFKSPRGRFIRGNLSVDRLSRVEELSERLSYLAEPAAELDAVGGVSPTPRSLPTSPNPRSFGEHRSVRRSVSGNVRAQPLPPTLQLAAPQNARPRKISLDILRPSRKSESTVREASSLESPASLRSGFISSPTTNKLSTTPKTPATPSFGEQLTPWRSTSFSTARSAGRTSFSQDRDRAPVASPISPPMPMSSSVGQAIKRLGIKSKGDKASKGIGPADVIVLDFDDEQGCGDDASNEMGSRPSMSVEARPSFGGGARPSFSSFARPSFGGGPRPSIEATGRNSLVAAEMVTKLLEVEASELVPSPVTPSFGQQLPKEMGGSSASLNRGAAIDGDASPNGGEMAGLGIGLVQWSDGMPMGAGDSIDASTSDGTFTSQGIQTPENGSLSHRYTSQLPYRTDPTGATTPHARPSMDTGRSMGTPGPAKSAELLAFEDMLGKFPQQQKSLLQHISARVAKTPNVGGGGPSSREEVTSSSCVFPDLSG